MTFNKAPIFFSPHLHHFKEEQVAEVDYQPQAVERITYYEILWGAICAKIKIQVAFTFTVVIYGFHDWKFIKTPIVGHIYGENCLIPSGITKSPTYNFLGWTVTMNR